MCISHLTFISSTGFILNLTCYSNLTCISNPVCISSVTCISNPVFISKPVCKQNHERILRTNAGLKPTVFRTLLFFFRQFFFSGAGQPYWIGLVRESKTQTNSAWRWTSTSPPISGPELTYFTMYEMGERTQSEKDKTFVDADKWVSEVDSATFAYVCEEQSKFYFSSNSIDPRFGTVCLYFLLAHKPNHSQCNSQVLRKECF